MATLTGRFSIKEKLVTDKAFYAKVLSIVLPVAAQQAINMGVNMMDTVMLGSFGEVQLSASSLANSFYQLFTILCMGIIGGCSVLVAQFWGAKDTKRAKQTLALAFWMAVIVGAVFAVITALFPSAIMKLFTPDEAVIAAGVRYLRITAFIYIIHGTGLVTCHLMRAVGQAKLGLYVSIISFCRYRPEIFWSDIFAWVQTIRKQQSIICANSCGSPSCSLLHGMS